MIIGAAKRSLIGGEIDPDLHHASDLIPVRIGAAICENFIVRAHGGVERTPGTEHLAIAKGSGKVRLGMFKRASSAAYLAEYTDGTLRLRSSDIAPGDPAFDEIDTPWGAAALDGLQFTQSNNVQWIFSGSPLMELQRYDGGSGWVFELVASEIENGPFLDANTDKEYRLTVTGELVVHPPLIDGDPPVLGPDMELEKADSITLTATDDLFLAGHVGAFFRIEEEDYSAVPRWEAGSAITAGQRVRFNTNVYEAVNDGNTSGNAPTHTIGNETDGTGIKDATPVEFKYLHPGYGIVKITAVTSPTEATAEILSDRLPDSTTAGTWRWSEGAWSDVNGYPAVGALYKDALWAAASTAEPFKLWKSAIEGFSDFEPGVNDDNALTRGLYGAQTEAIRWLAPAAYMAIGTDGPEWVARPDQKGDTVRVSNLITEEATDQGSSDIPGIVISGTTIFVDASRRSLLGMRYDYRNDAWVPRDLSLLARHILGQGVVQIAYQRNPWPLIWCLLEDGTLGALTYQPDQEVLAWHRHDFGDPVESIAVLPVEDGQRETLFLAVRRKPDETHIERMVDRFRPERGASIADAQYLFGAVAYDLPEAQATFSGLDHLEGREVIALIDGNSHPPIIVTGGAVTLNFAGKKVFIGLRYKSRYQTLPFDFGQPEDFQSGRPKRIADLLMAFRATLGGVIRMGKRAERVFKLGAAPLDQAPPLYTGVRRINPPASEDTGQLEYVTEEAWPATIVAIFPEYEV